MATGTCLCMTWRVGTYCSARGCPRQYRGSGDYAVEGKQYLAIPVGGGRVAGAVNTLFVFGVPDAVAARQ